jgi:hypothetical protein
MIPETNFERRLKLHFLMGLILGVVVALFACEIRHFLE